MIVSVMIRRVKLQGCAAAVRSSSSDGVTRPSACYMNLVIKHFENFV